MQQMRPRYVVPFAQIARLREVTRARGAAIAILAPLAPEQQSAEKMLGEAVALCASLDQDATLIGGTSEWRAAAVIAGLRVSTSVEEWECWLNDTEARTFRAERRRRLSTAQGWRILQFTPPHESLPTYVVRLGERSGFPVRAEVATRADERYEDTLIATISATGGYAYAEYQTHLG